MIAFPGLVGEALPLVLGANPFGWTADEDESFTILDAYLDRGGRLVDTADGYSYWAPGNRGGESEEIIGRWMARRGNRDRVHLATKVARHPEFTGLSAANVAAAARASLARLQTDRVDLYYAHYDDPEVDLAESVAAFDLLVDEGLVGAVGLSNFTADRIQAWIDTADAGGHRRPVVLQPHYNLLNRRVFEQEQRPVAERAGIGAVPYFALASGMLTGKYRDEEEARRSPRAHLMAPYLSSPRTFEIIDALRAVAEESGTTPAIAAIAWLRRQPGVIAPIASAKSIEQLDGLVEAVRFELGPDQVERLTEVSAPAE